MSALVFEATLYKPDPQENLGDVVLVGLPQNVSDQLPSRGMVMVEGTMNGASFLAPVEPDGNGGHWFKVGEELMKAAGARPGAMASLAVSPTKQWREPNLPADLQIALDSDSKACAAWKDITTVARWDFIRWICAAKQAQTRQRRIEVACSKLRSGQRRPCCFDRSQRTLTDA